jgi:adenylosuccinate lyase
MRSEIAEVAEAFEEGQVGSATMANKRNPVNFEHLEAMWIKNKNEFGKVQDTMISEHQRDLTGSAVARDFPIILVNLLQQLNALLRKDDKEVPFLSRITIDPEACERNFELCAHLILAEPLYIALQMAGYEGDAHELVNRHLTPVAQIEGRTLIQVLEEFAERDSEIHKALAHIPQEIRQLLHEPRRYTGLAKEKALEIARLAEVEVRRM